MSTQPIIFTVVLSQQQPAFKIHSKVNSTIDK